MTAPQATFQDVCFSDNSHLFGVPMRVIGLDEWALDFEVPRADAVRMLEEAPRRLRGRLSPRYGEALEE